MKVLASLLVLGRLWAACSSPVCPDDCTFTTKYEHLDFHHVSDLKGSSVAPWDLKTNTTDGREPETIMHAVCKKCIMKDLIAKPIYIQISVYKKVRNGTGGAAWCKCPYDLAVGCTCVAKHQQHPADLDKSQSST